MLDDENSLKTIFLDEVPYLFTGLLELQGIDQSIGL